MLACLVCTVPLATLANPVNLSFREVSRLGIPSRREFKYPKHYDSVDSPSVGFGFGNFSMGHPGLGPAGASIVSPLNILFIQVRLPE
jgi:hypothetical protein